MVTPNNEELQAALEAGVEELAVALLGEPTKRLTDRKSMKWGAKGSLTLSRQGRKRGSWFDFEAGCGGGPLQLIVHVRRCCYDDAKRWAQEWLRLPPERRDVNTGVHPAAALISRLTDDTGRDADEAGRIATARALWKSSEPIAETLGESYLIQRRGIQRPPHGWPDAVRFHAGSGALIVAGTDTAGSVRFVQRIRLTAEGSKIEASAGLPVKQTSGVVSGATVRLPGSADGPVLLAEGPETGLSLWVATDFETHIAIGAMSNHAPPTGRKVVVCRDDDKAQSAADKTLGRVLAVWHDAGADVVTATPWPVRRFDKTDFNDTLREAGPAAVRVRIDAALCADWRPVTRLSVSDARLALDVAIDGFFSDAAAWDDVRQKFEKQAKADLTADAQFAVEVVKARTARAESRAASAEASRLAKVQPATDDSRAAAAAAQEAARAARERALEASEIASVFEPETRKLQSDIRKAAKAKGRATSGAPPVHAVKVDVGTGKSATMRRAVAASLRRMRDAGDERTVAVAVPTHALGTEQAALFEAEPGVVAGGLLTAIWRGREAKDPDAPGRKMCQDLDAVADAREALADPQTTVCRQTEPDGVRECFFFNECAYQRQRSTEADVWFVAHEMLFFPKPAALGDLAVVVVDEAAWQDGLIGADGNHVRISLDTFLQDDDVPGLPLSGQRLRFLRRRIHDELVRLPDGPLPRSAVMNADIRPEAANEARALEWMRKVDVDIYPNMSTRERKAAVLAAAINRTIARMASFWRAMEALARDDGPDASGWVALAVEDTREGAVRVIRLKGCKPIGTDWDVPTLLIDATLQLDLVRPFWPGVELTAAIQVETPHQHIRQVTDRSYSKARMSKDGALRDVHATICREARRHAPGRVLVVAQLDTEEALPSLGPLPINVELAHHNAIAGRDEWGAGPGRAGITLLIVVGRTAPPPAAVERMAEALTGAAIAPLLAWYDTADSVREMADGSAVFAQADRHPHLIAHAIRWQIAEGELVQIIGRARGVNRTEVDPVEILVMTNTPLPVPISQTIRAADLDPSPWDLMLAAGAVALNSPTDAATAYPGLWATANAAQLAFSSARWRGGWGQNKGATRDSRINSLLYEKDGKVGETVPNLLEVSYQLAGVGRTPSVALYDPAIVPDLAAWLIDKLGALAWFRSQPDQVPDLNGVEAMAARGLVSWTSRHAAMIYPDLFVSPEAAKKAIERVLAGRRVSDLECVARLTCRVRYRIAGAGTRPTIAQVNLDLIPDPAAWLAERLKLASCEVVEVAPAVDQPATDAVEGDADVSFDAGLREFLESINALEISGLTLSEGLPPSSMFPPMCTEHPVAGLWKVPTSRSPVPLQITDLPSTPWPDPDNRLVWFKTRPKVGEAVLVGFAALLPAEAWAPAAVC